MRNPKWHRDEIILALDLYFSSDRGSIDKKNPKIIELSERLNSLPLFVQRSDEEKFRNPNGVATKLSNFLALDSRYGGKGLTHGSKLDKKLFEEYDQRQELLHSVAREIRDIINDDLLRSKILLIEDDEQTIDDSVIEGQVIYKLHKLRERDPKIVNQKKVQVFNISGKLECEICEFSFQEFYGILGAGFIECHHRVPLSKFKAESRTRLDDLALVCSNCHRMLHRRIDNLSIPELKLIIVNAN
jgi:5-methylcytosine-specific restriction protein A